MRKGWIILSVSLSVVAGSIAAYGVSRLTAGQNQTATTVTYTDRLAENHFTSAPDGSTQNILPDFTTAAENGVEAVVNISLRILLRPAAGPTAAEPAPAAGTSFGWFGRHHLGRRLHRIE